MRFIYLGGSGTRAEPVNGARLARRSAGRWTTSAFNLETILDRRARARVRIHQTWVYQSQERDRVMNALPMRLQCVGTCTSSKEQSCVSAEPRWGVLRPPEVTSSVPTVRRLAASVRS